MSNDIILYDLPSRGRCQSWSGNVWKTRLALNYKSLPYLTSWLPYTKLHSTLSALNIPPNPKPNWSDYSVPTVQFPDGHIVMDSENIARQLETLQPEPSLYLDKGVHKEIEAAMKQIAGPLIPVFMPRVARDVVAEGDEQWFEEDRARRFGMSLRELEAAKGGEKAWEAAGPGFDKLREILRREEGPFVLGRKASYGDFMIVAVMKMMEVLGEDAFGKFVGQGAELRALWDACKQWTRKDD